MSRVVVIGAGMAGLAVAARLAVKGHDVTVLEQAATHGGKVGTYSRDGFTFDTGPSLLTLPAVWRDTFLKTGRPLEDCLELVPVDPACHYRFADGTEVDVPNSRQGAIEAFDGAFGGSAGSDWRAFLRHAGAVWDVTRKPFLQSPQPSARDLLRMSRDVRALRTVAPWRSLADVGNRMLRDERLRTYLWRYATYTGSDPRRAPAALCVVPWVEQTFGSWYVSGGLRALADALLTRCEERGVTVRLGAEVTRIELSGGRVAGVTLVDGERVAADVVVANADAAEVYDRLLPHDAGAARPARRRLRRADPSSSAFVLLLALRERLTDLAHHTVLFPEDYPAELDALHGREPHPVDDPTIYLSAPDDPALRPPDGGEAVFLLVNAPRHTPGSARSGVDWDAPGMAEAYAERVLDVLARRGIDVRPRLLWRETRTPADLERATRAPGGAIYGTASHGARSTFLRADNRSPVPGLFLASGSSHPGGGLPLVGLAAEHVAGLVGRA